MQDEKTILEIVAAIDQVCDDFTVYYSFNEFAIDMYPLVTGSTPIQWNEENSNCIHGYLLMFQKLLLAYLLASPEFSDIKKGMRDSKLEKFDEFYPYWDFSYMIPEALENLFLKYIENTGIWSIGYVIIHMAENLPEDSIAGSNSCEQWSNIIHETIMRELPSEAAAFITTDMSPHFLADVIQCGGNPNAFAHIWESDILYQISVQEAEHRTDLGQKILHRAEIICSTLIKTRPSSEDYNVHYLDHTNKKHVMIFLEHDDLYGTDYEVAIGSVYLYNMQYIWEIEHMKGEIELYKKEILKGNTVQ